MTRIDAAFLSEDGSRVVSDMLTDADYQAWFVGGCVRNALLGVPVSDVDMATDARPDVVLALAKAAGLKAIPTGIDHGTVTVIADGRPFEITTFRNDVKTDGRHAEVAFSDHLEDDAARRDFTMNALYAGIDGDVIDPVGGLPDLRARRVRFIGDANARITEDYLRILRFFRFHATYGDPHGGIDADGLAACAERQDGIDQLSKERIGAETLKLLAAPNPAPSVAAMGSSGILWRVLPGATADALAVLIHLEAGLAPDPIRRLAAMGGEDATANLRLSRAQSKRLAALRDAALGTDQPAVLGYRLGPDDGRDALLIRSALIGTSISETEFDAVTHGAKQAFPVTPADLMPAMAGKALGERLKHLEDQWIASGFALSRAALLEISQD